MSDDILTMWAEVVADEETGKPVWRCHEASSQEGAGNRATVELGAHTFPIGTRLHIHEPRDDSAIKDEVTF